MSISQINDFFQMLQNKWLSDKQQEDNYFDSLEKQWCLDNPHIFQDSLEDDLKLHIAFEYTPSKFQIKHIKFKPALQTIIEQPTFADLFR